ncbi:glutathione binding-like protein [Roseomonas sp. NAR14]|uniref:Glutathione binding-like protein n=1 Tax=Roseomonas acroporae TaxID=2937791 RepID=A0A9X1YBC8_9PROT|nr:glutathione S-transferase C-terminal domain-containing protein [Roseomonas acroporae]MCK8786978.1 glutathione binding-like protein [Roseomonas acroporae]
MKLYYGPGACSMGIHVILEEIGKPYALEPVALKDGAQHQPAYKAVNPKSKVPALAREGRPILTEWPAIAFCLATSSPEAGLWPKDPEEQVRALEVMDYVAGTIHAQGFTRMFRPANFAPGEADLDKVKAQGRANAEKGFAIIDQQWQGGDWVLPSGYSVADAALFFVEYWAAKRAGVPLPPRLAAHFERMLARPAVRRALEQEGLSA